MKPKEEIEFLKQIVKAQAQMLVAYRLGKNSVPTWTLDILAKAHKHYKGVMTNIDGGKRDNKILK